VNFKKWVGILLFVVLALSTVTYGEEKSTMTWAGWSGEEASTKPAIQEMISTWNAKNPDTQVEWAGWPWAKTFEQLVIRTQGGEKLDIAQIDMSWIPSLNEMDVLEDLTPLLGESWLKKNMNQATIDSGKMNKKLLTVPWTLASIGMLYNPTLLEKAGVKKVPKTIAEFEKALAALKKADPNIIPYALTTKDAGSVGADFQAWIWTFGGKIIDEDGKVVINSAAGVKTVKWMKNLLDKGYIKMDISRFDARQLFAQSQVGFYDDAVMARGIAKTNGVPEADLDKTIMPMLRPVVKFGDKPQSGLWGHFLGVFKKSQNKQKAVEFIKHILSKEESLMYYEKAAMVPVVKSAAESEPVKKDLWVAKFLEITKYGKKGEVKNYAKANEMNSIITEELQAALLGTKTPEKALDDAALRIQGATK
jgi:multiple sugar transport system substrate-binding protein